MKENLLFESDTLGLWPRFVTKLIASVLISYFILLWVLAVVSAMLNFTFFVYAIFPIMGFIIWKIFQQIPLNWDNSVMVDFKNQSLNISQKKLNRNEMEILDYDGRQIAFDEIKSYNTQNYESVIFKSYYLVSINARGKKIKCLSFKDPNKYVEFLKILHDMDIQLKK